MVPGSSPRPSALPQSSGIDVLGERVHVVLGVDGVDVLVEAELGVVDDVEPLLAGRDAAGQRRVEDAPGFRGRRTGRTR